MKLHVVTRGRRLTPCADGDGEAPRGVFTIVPLVISHARNQLRAHLIGSLVAVSVFIGEDGGKKFMPVLALARLRELHESNVTASLLSPWTFLPFRDVHDVRLRLDTTKLFLLSEVIFVCDALVDTAVS